MQFQVIELFVLVSAVAFEEIGEIVGSFADFLVEVGEGGFGALLEFFDLEMEFGLLFFLCFQSFLEMVNFVLR